MMLVRFIRSCSKCSKHYFVIVILLILLLSLYLYQHFGLFPVAPITVTPNLNSRPTRHLSKLVTVVFRQFEDFENDAAGSVQALVSTFPNMPVLLISDKAPYPPLPFSLSNETLRNVRVISLEFKLTSTPEELDPLSYIHTEFVLFLTDDTKVSRKVLQQATTVAITSSNAIAIGTGAKLSCQYIKWYYPDWTLNYSKNPTATLCDSVQGEHALLIKTSLLRTLPRPLVQPLPEALYLQTAVRNIVVQIFEGEFGSITGSQKSPASKQHNIKRIRNSLAAFYKTVGIKAVIRDDKKVHWFGCRKDSQRCFPTVQRTPSYVLAGRNMPPCCHRNLRRTVSHVLHNLMSYGVRCWLETTSLLGAIVRQDILPYAEYAEIGVHASDINQVSLLSRGGVDPEGFVWERATKGRYYRVAFSASNRIYILILPFIARNGTMWPDDWVLAHQREFPERHLHPLAQIKFVGRQAPAPNDARAFLDLKLGANAVERSTMLGGKFLYPQ